jgi:phosphate-selective porin OprO/OprP
MEARTGSGEALDSWGAGVNWYINRNLKLVLDYDQTQFDGGARNADRKTEKVFGQRLQISY